MREIKFRGKGVGKSLTLGSLFDGIGGFPHSASKVGIKAVWASEIEPWPIKVTEKHFPGMAHLGDLTKVNGAEIPPVDIISFGSPCQDLSIAGKREGLEGARSGLFMEAMRIVKEMREATYGIYPRYAVWENVPGAFSSNKGQDFRAVLEEIGDAEIPMPESGRWATAGMVRTETADIAWRVIDAQHWGVPQRRRRIYLVADFGGTSAGEVLFIEPGLPWNFEKGREAGQEATGGAGVGIKDAMYWDGGQISDCLDVSMLSKGQMMPKKRRFPAVLLTQREGCDGGRNAPFIAFAANQRGEVIEPQLYDMTHANEVMRLVEPGLAPTLNSRMGTGGNQVPIIMEPMAVHQNQNYAVRRLTPLECLRLQGYPDWWLDIEGMSDTAKYKAIGNSLAIPCSDFVMAGIARVMREESERCR